MNESVHLLAGAYALDALDPDERVEFEAHLTTCTDCSDEVRGMLATAARLASAESVHPPAGLKRAVLAQVARTPQERAPGGFGDGAAAHTGSPAALSTATGSGIGAHPPRRSTARDVVVPLRARRTQRLLAAAAAVLAVVAVGLSALVLQTRSDRNALADRQQQLSAVLTAGDTRTIAASMPGGGRALLVISDSRHEAALVGTGMSTPPPGHVYQLWYMNGSAKPASAGVFTPNGNGTAAVLLHGDPATAAQIGLTVEPDGGSPEPTTTPIIAVPIKA